MKALSRSCPGFALTVSIHERGPGEKFGGLSRRLLVMTSLDNSVAVEHGIDTDVSHIGVSHVVQSPATSSSTLWEALV